MSFGCARIPAAMDADEQSRYRILPTDEYVIERHHATVNFRISRSRAKSSTASVETGWAIEPEGTSRKVWWTRRRKKRGPWAVADLRHRGAANPSQFF